MQVLPLGRSGLAQTAFVYALTLAALALFGLVLAYWTWVWLAPRAEPRAEPAAGEAGNLASAGRVFGRAERNKNSASPTGIAIKLLGIVAASGGRRGYAVVQLDAKQILAVHEGEDVTPGVRLAEVLRDHVILERAGVRETLAWPSKQGSATPAAQVAGPVAARVADVAAPKAAEAAAPKPAEVAAPARVAEPVAPRGRRSAGRQNESD
jgi:general secretion pathway protein C